jgi:hypothetical protein
VFACTKANLNGKAMKMVYTRRGRREPAEEDEPGLPDQTVLLTGGGVGVMMIGISEAIDGIDESDERDEHVEDAGDDGTMA